MPDDQPPAAKRSNQPARIRVVYGMSLREPHLSDQEIDAMRQHVIRLARTLCEHVWGKQFW